MRRHPIAVRTTETVTRSTARRRRVFNSKIPLDRKAAALGPDVRSDESRRVIGGLSIGPREIEIACDHGATGGADPEPGVHVAEREHRVLRALPMLVVGSLLEVDRARDDRADAERRGDRAHHVDRRWDGTTRVSLV